MNAVTPPRRPHRLLRAGVGLALLAAFPVAGCGGDAQDRLDAIASDPMASVTLPGVELVDDARTAGSDSSAGLSSPSSVTRTLSAPDSEFESLIEALAGLARDAGWELESRAAVPAPGYHARRDIDGYSTSLIISGLEHEHVVWVTVTSDAPA